MKRGDQSAFEYFYIFCRTKLYECGYMRVSNQRWYGVSESTRIGTPSEHTLREGRASRHRAELVDRPALGIEVLSLI